MALERLQKIIAAAGIASRRKAEELIEAGAVSVNGTTITELGSKADPETDSIRVNDKLLKGAERHEYIALNKPRGYVTTVSDPEGRATVMELIRSKARLYPIGRLDFNSEGLLLLTNDGDLAHKLMKAASHIPKTYLVKVAGEPAEEQLRRLRTGVTIAEERDPKRRVKTAPAQIRVIKEADNPWLEVILHEGRNRQIRKMFEEIGHHVEKIRRVRYGPLELDLPPGESRPLTAQEISRLQHATDPQARERLGNRREPFRESGERPRPFVKERTQSEARPPRSQGQRRQFSSIPRQAFPNRRSGGDRFERPSRFDRGDETQQRERPSRFGSARSGTNNEERRFKGFERGPREQRGGRDDRENRRPRPSFAARASKPGDSPRFRPRKEDGGGERPRNFGPGGERDQRPSNFNRFEKRPPRFGARPRSDREGSSDRPARERPQRGGGGESSFGKPQNPRRAKSSAGKKTFGARTGNNRGPQFGSRGRSKGVDRASNRGRTGGNRRGPNRGNRGGRS